MNAKLLKKRLFIESAAAVAVISIIGAGAWYMDTTNTNYAGETQTAEKEVNELTVQAKTLLDKFTRVQKNPQLFHDILQKKSRNELLPTRQAIRTAFNQFTTSYHLLTVHLSMGEIAPLKGSPYIRPTSNMVSSEVSAEFNAISDEYVYGLINAMDTQLPGVTKINKLTMSLDKPLSEAILREISQKGSYPLIKTKLSFSWIGIKPVEANDPNANAPKITH